MARIIVVTSGKGGVGKTTTSAAIAMGLAKKGHKTVVIDFDVGLRNLDLIMGCERRVVYDFVNVINEEATLNQALIRDKNCNLLYILPASQTRDKDALSQEGVGKILDELKKDFKYIVCDSPAGIEQGFRNALAAADEAIVITTPEVSAIQDADRVISLIEANAGMRPRLVINRLRPQMIEKGNMMGIQDILELLAVSLLGIVPEDEEIIISSNQGIPIVHNKEKLAGQAYRNIVARIEGQEVPFLTLNGQKGFWGRFKRLFAV